MMPSPALPASAAEFIEDPALVAKLTSAHGLDTPPTFAYAGSNATLRNCKPTDVDRQWSGFVSGASPWRGHVTQHVHDGCRWPARPWCGLLRVGKGSPAYLSNPSPLLQTKFQ